MTGPDEPQQLPPEVAQDGPPAPLSLFARDGLAGLVGNLSLRTAARSPMIACMERGPLLVAILLFERLTALDAVGPYEVLSRIPGATVTFAAAEPGPKRTDNGRLALTADAALAEVPAPDVVVVPGGAGRRALMEDGPVHEWLRAAHESSTWTGSVCTGSLILAATGLLQARRATTHWLALDELQALGAEAVSERVVFDGKIVTAAGVSAGIDMALELAARIAGEDVARAIQLAIEYDPRPPFDSGSPQRARPELVHTVRSAAAARASV